MPPTFGDLASLDPGTVPVLALLAIAAAVLYLAGVVRLRLARRRWSIGRTICFLLGCLLIVVVSATGVERYGQQLFSIFMFQQLTLMMAVPPLLVLGSTGTLVLRATPHRGLGRLVLRMTLAAARARWIAWILHPAFGVPLYLLSFYGLYFGGLADPVLALPGGHLLLESAFLLVGVVFAVPILSSDPLPLRLTYPLRVLDVLVEMALHAFFGVIVMSSTSVLVEQFTESTIALGLTPIGDQRIAGALAWSYGEGPTVFMLLYLLHRWFRYDTSRARAADRRADRDGDVELDAYNDYLERLRGSRHSDPAN